MNIIPYETMRNIDNIRREIDRVYRFPYHFFEENFHSHLSVPFTDVYETEEQIIVSCDIPGIQTREDIQIHIRHHELTISGTVNSEHAVQNDRMHQKERFSGQFRRTVTLPVNVSGDLVKAVYKNGVLRVFIPKLSAGDQRSVTIDFEN